MLNARTLAVFSIGFRPFFLMAGISSVALIYLWVRFLAGAEFPQNYYSPLNWHAHEMLFGYGVAVFSGFLLTAVGNWTGRKIADGIKLAALALLWLLGRLMPFTAGSVPNELIALIDLSFLPCLIVYLAIPIWQQKKIKNLPVLLLLLAMFLANLFFHLELLGVTQLGLSSILQAVIGAMLVFIAIIAGRVIPFFVRSGAKGSSPIVWPMVEKVSVLSIVALMVLKPFDYGSTLFLLCSLIAMVSNTIRITGWYCKPVIKVPLLWVLFTGYAWMIVGIGLDFLAAVEVVSPALALHAMTAGSIGVLTLGMMSRVSLGHTGRPLKASKLIASAFALVNIAVLFRVIAPIIVPAKYSLFLHISSGFWLLAFACFVFYYTPVLLRPRADELN